MIAISQRDVGGRNTEVPLYFEVTAVHLPIIRRSKYTYLPSFITQATGRIVTFTVPVDAMMPTSVVLTSFAVLVLVSPGSGAEGQWVHLIRNY